ncbi:MAG: hypothetical protein N3F67_01715 [Acidilobaceae archaeon]|nr:hypothetical protein [Acidilobaceae archaeon]
MRRAIVRRKNNLAVVEAEGGQRALVPWRALCELAEMLKLELVLEDGTRVECSKVRR